TGPKSPLMNRHQALKTGLITLFQAPRRNIPMPVKTGLITLFHSQRNTGPRAALINLQIPMNTGLTAPFHLALRKALIASNTAEATILKLRKAVTKTSER